MKVERTWREVQIGEPNDPLYRLFEEEIEGTCTGRFAIADETGANPDTCNGGAMFIDFGRRIQLENRAFYRLPCYRDDGWMGYVTAPFQLCITACDKKRTYLLVQTPKMEKIIFDD